jgi:hypothetical protein
LIGVGVEGKERTGKEVERKRAFVRPILRRDGKEDFEPLDP